MSKLNKLYNWNGDYELLKEIEKEKRWRNVGDGYPEIFFIFYDEDKEIRYTIIDDNFGFPSLANELNTPYAIKLRKRSIQVLDELEKQGYIKKIKKIKNFFTKL